jgi:hypothetical protein
MPTARKSNELNPPDRLMLSETDRVWCEGLFVHQYGSRGACGSAFHRCTDLRAGGQAENEIDGVVNARRDRSELHSDGQTAELIVENEVIGRNRKRSGLGKGGG